MDTGGPEGDDDIPLPTVLSRDDLVLGYVSETGSGQVDAVDHLRKDSDLSSDDLHVGQFRTLLKSDSDLFGDLFVGLVDGDVVHEGCGLGVDADGVVDIHGYAVYADGVPDAELFRYQDLGSDAVGRQGHISVAEIDQTGEEAGLMYHLSESGPLVLQLLN